METANWDELDKFRFYTIGPLVFLGVRAVVYPSSLVKTRLQVQQGHTLYNGLFDAFVKILRHEGVRGLYKGFLVNCWGILGGQFYITVYEVMRSRVLPLQYAESFRNFIAGCVEARTAPTAARRRHRPRRGRSSPHSARPRPWSAPRGAVIAPFPSDGRARACARHAAPSGAPRPPRGAETALIASLVPIYARFLTPLPSPPPFLRPVPPPPSHRRPSSSPWTSCPRK